jgi:hypothetical protein
MVDGKEFLFLNYQLTTINYQLFSFSSALKRLIADSMPFSIQAITALAALPSAGSISFRWSGVNLPRT